VDVNSISNNQHYFLDLGIKEPAEFNYTKSGLLRVKGAIARTGEMEYLTNDGDIYYQYVPPETLFADEHLESIAGLPVTLYHPDETVTPENYSKYAIGSVGDRVLADHNRGLVEVIFTLGDATAIKAATQDGINQLSMGYWAELTPHPYKKDTYIQTKRVGNHIAIVDQARGGEKLKLNLDSYNITQPRTKALKNSNSLKEESLWRTLYVMV
jgi:hypothetical protein